MFVLQYHCWGSTGPDVQLGPRKQTEQGVLETTLHHRHSHNCPQMSTTDGCSLKKNRKRNWLKLKNITNGASNRGLCVSVSHLSAPEFDGPVERGGDKEMREVNRSTSAVTAQPGHWTMVAFKHLSDTRLTATHTRYLWWPLITIFSQKDFAVFFGIVLLVVHQTHFFIRRTFVAMRTEVEENSPAVATGGVNRAILAPHHEVVHIAKRESHGGDSHCLALFEHQLQTVLQGKKKKSHSLILPDEPTELCNSVSVSHQFSVPAVARACQGSRSTFCHQWKCWSGC